MRSLHCFLLITCPAPNRLDHRRFIAYAQIGALGEICLAWHKGVLTMGRDELVNQLVDLWARIDGAFQP